MIRAIKKHLAIRSYRNKLGPWLEQHCGWHATYSPKQVRSGASSLGLAIDPLCYAYAMFCTHSDFDAHHTASGEACDYDAMRSEISAIEASGSGDSEGGFFDSAGDSGDCGGGDSGGGD